MVHVCLWSCFQFIISFFFFAVFLHEIGWIKKNLVHVWMKDSDGNAEMKNKQRRLKQLAEKWESHGWKIHERWASESLWTTSNINYRKKMRAEKMHLWWWQAMMEICGKNAKLFRASSIFFLLWNIFNHSRFHSPLWKHISMPYTVWSFESTRLCFPSVCVRVCRSVGRCVGAPTQWRVRRTFWFSFHSGYPERRSSESEKKVDENGRCYYWQADKQMWIQMVSNSSQASIIDGVRVEWQLCWFKWCFCPSIHLNECYPNPSSLRTSKNEHLSLLWFSMQSTTYIFNSSSFFPR